MFHFEIYTATLPGPTSQRERVLNRENSYNSNPRPRPRPNSDFNHYIYIMSEATGATGATGASNEPEIDKDYKHLEQLILAAIQQAEKLYNEMTATTAEIPSFDLPKKNTKNIFRKSIQIIENTIKYCERKAFLSPSLTARSQYAYGRYEPFRNLDTALGRMRQVPDNIKMLIKGSIDLLIRRIKEDEETGNIEKDNNCLNIVVYILVERYYNEGVIHTSIWRGGGIK